MKHLLKIFLLVLLIFSCSKKEVTPVPNCTLQSFDTDSPETGMTSAKYEYDTQGRLTKLTNDETNLQTTYSYFSSQVNATQLNQKTGSISRYVYDLNSKGLAIALNITFSNSTSKQKYTYEYDANDYTIKTTYQLTDSNNQITSQRTTISSYQDGNLITSESDDASKVTYTYYTDKVLSYNVGLIFLGKRSTNFIKTVQYVSSKSTVYTYSKTDNVNEYDNSGFLTKQTQIRTKTSDGSTSTLKLSNYKFSCQ